MYQNDDGFEKELRDGLRLREAPAGFSGRVMALAQRQAQPVLAMPPRMPRAMARMGQWAIAAAVLLSVGLGGFLEQRREQRIAGERARDQVLLALRITSATLQTVHNRIADSTQ